MIIKLNISNEQINYETLNLQNGYVDKKNIPTYINSIYKSINNSILKNKMCDYKDAWLHFTDYVTKNKFKLHKVLGLKKGTKSLSNWLKDNNDKKNLKNIAMILNSSEPVNNNTIVLYLEYKKSEKLNLFDVFLTRIEFLNMNIEQNDYLENNNFVEIDNKYQDNILSDEEKEIYNFETIFEDDDYKDDPIKFNEWYKLLTVIDNGLKDIKENDIKNFIVKYNDKNILLSESPSDFRGYVLFDKNLNNVINKNDDLLIPKCERIDFIENLIELINNNIKEKTKKENDISLKEDEINKYTNNLDSLNKELDDLNTKLDLLKKEFNSFNKKENNPTNTNIEYGNEKIKELINTKEKQINDKKIKIKNEENNISKFKNEHKELKKDIDDIKNIIDNIKKFIDQIQNEKYSFFYELSFNNTENDISFPLLNFSNEKNISDYDIFSLVSEVAGTKTIIKRFKNAIDNVKDGYYKNPFFYIAIKNPNQSLTKIILKNNIPQIITNKYKLNKKQKLAIHKAINTNSAFYLQGPPGTGKTQTISAISEWITLNNMNLIITSSTHEAINNFFDRIYDNNLKNPNLIAIKYRFYKKDETKLDQKFSENNLFKIFKQRMINNVVPIEDNVNKKNNLIKKINEYIKKYGNETPQNNFIPRPLVKYLFNLESKDPFWNNFIVENSEDSQQKINPIMYEEKMTKNIEKLLENYEKVPKNKEYTDILNDFINISTDDTIKSINFKDYMCAAKLKETLVSKPSNNILENKLNALKNKYDEIEYNDKYESCFLDYIIENKLINIIGLTTSAKNQIKIKEKEIDLFSNYPIDYIIIDEISKCAMPEIFSKAILTKKIIFAGDYKQLPPTPNIINDIVMNILIKSNFLENLGVDGKTSSDKLEDNSETSEQERKKSIISDYICELYKTSFFTILVDKIKKIPINDTEKPYEFLNESHRFGEKNMELVNLNYPDEEKLIKPENSNFNERLYDLKFDNININSPCSIINLKEISNDFKKSHYDFPNNINNSFDQIGTPFNFNNNSLNINPSSSYNQYSAWIIVHVIIEKLILSNQNALLKNNFKIGVIALTITQKKIILEYLRTTEYFSKYEKIIKVDTIDNFQGREEEIIIVDFIRGKDKIENKTIRHTKSRNLSFLKQKERINVAISRAKQKLILVGWFDYLKEKDELFSQYYKKLSISNDSYFDIINKD